MKAAALAALLVVAGCGNGPRAPGPTGYYQAPHGRFEAGKATWYGGKHHGGPTASGETFDQFAFTAAHKTLPFDTMVRVVSHANGRKVVVRINDRGPYGKGRIIDVSFAAARALGMVDAGVVPVHLEIVKRGSGKYQRNRRPPP